MTLLVALHFRGKLIHDAVYDHYSTSFWVRMPKQQLVLRSKNLGGTEIRTRDGWVRSYKVTSGLPVRNQPAHANFKTVARTSSVEKIEPD